LDESRINAIEKLKADINMGSEDVDSLIGLFSSKAHMNDVISLDIPNISNFKKIYKGWCKEIKKHGLLDVKKFMLAGLMVAQRDKRTHSVLPFITDCRIA